MIDIKQTDIDRQFDEIFKTKYACPVCGTFFFTKEEAKMCESMPIDCDRGVVSGDLIVVKITKKQNDQIMKVLLTKVHQLNGRHIMQVFVDDKISRVPYSLLYDDYRLLEEEDIIFPAVYDEYIDSLKKTSGRKRMESAFMKLKDIAIKNKIVITMATQVRK